MRQFSSLIGVFGEQLAGEPDQARRRLAARTCDHARVHQHFGASETARLAVLLELRVEQGHHVVGRVVGAPVDVLREQLLAVLEQVSARSAELALGQRDRAVRGIPDHRLVLFRYAQQVADRAHRNLSADVTDEVESVRVGEGFERAHTVLARQRLDRLHPPRRENS